MAMKRVVLIVDINDEGADLWQAPSRPGQRQLWLDDLVTGIKFGIGDALHLKHPVDVVESMVTDPEFEMIAIINKTLPNPLRAALKISG